MALFRSRSYLLSRRHAFLLLLALYLLVGLSLAAPANAEHLSHKRSHVRKSIEVANSNVKRPPARKVVDSRQRDRRQILGIDLPGLGVTLGGDDGTLLGVTFPNSNSSSTSASAFVSAASSSSASSQSSTSSETGTTSSTSSATDASPSTSSATIASSSTPSSVTVASSSTSPSATIASPSTPSATGAPTSERSSSSVSSSTASATSSTVSEAHASSPTKTTDTPSPSSSCVGLLGLDLICTPVSSSSSANSAPSSSDAPETTAQSGSGSSAPGASNPTSSAQASNPTSSTDGGASSVSNGGGPTSATASGPASTSSSSSVAAPPSSSSEQCDGVVSVDLLGNPLCILPTGASSSVASTNPTTTTASPGSSSSQSTDTGSAVPPTSSSGDANPSSLTDTASSTCSGLLCGILPTATSQSSSAETSSATFESCTGLLCGILPTETTASESDSSVPSETSDASNTLTSTESGSAAPSATSDASSCSELVCSITSILPTITSALPETTSAVSPNENSTSIGPITSASSEGSNSTITSAPPESTSAVPTNGNSTSTESIANASSEGLNSTITSAPITTPETNATSTAATLTNATSATGESSIAFPTGNTTISSSLVTLTPTSTVEPSIASQFSFLTQSSLLFSEISSSFSSSLVTLTNPDEPTSSATLESAVTGATVSSVPLPSGLPARIYPAEGGVTADTDLTDYTSVSILFDDSLGWQFVATNTDSAAQMFAYFPPCLQVALGVSSDQVKTFALQVLETSEYKSPDDVDQLRTIFIAYIPSDNVTALEQAIKARQSDLYTKSTGISAQLAQRIDASYSVTSYPDPISENPSSSSTSDASSSSSDTRRDAIIGVCSALGGIAFCILGFLVYRNFRRRQEAAHQRLADPQMDVGPVPGQEFDRDSIGGQRRRSFYYAEDSLRGYSQPPLGDEIYAHNVSPAPGGGGGMRERRPIVPGTISAPILRDNTLNW